MDKIAKNKEVLGQLLELVTKQASAPKPVATGVPGKEPNSGAVSEKHDHTNQNAVGPEHLAPQNHEQKPSTDPAKPTDGKKAEEAPVVAVAAPAEVAQKAAEATPVVAPAPDANVTVEKLGKDILDLVQKFANNPVATGVPSKDPKWEAVSEKHDHVDQNAVKPETLHPQAHSQKPATDPAVPVAHAKKADEEANADKVASYELGKLWGELVIKKAYDDQMAQVKEAGRRDFELLVAQAAAQMKQASRQAEKPAVDTEKQAEAKGAAAFQNLYKQAQVEQAVAQIVAQNEQMAAKLAEFEKSAAAKETAHQAELQAKQAQLDQITAEEREQQKFASLAQVLEQRIVERLRTEVLTGK